MAKVKCGNCQEMGHMKWACTNDHVAEDDSNTFHNGGREGMGGDADNWENADTGGGSAGDFNGGYSTNDFNGGNSAGGW